MKMMMKCVARHLLPPPVKKNPILRCLEILDKERKLQAFRNLAQTLASSNKGVCPYGATLYSDHPSLGGSFEASCR